MNPRPVDLNELCDVVLRRRAEGADVARIQVDDLDTFAAAVDAALAPLRDLPSLAGPLTTLKLWGIPVEVNHWLPLGFGVQLDAKGNVVGAFRYEEPASGG